MQLYQLAIFVAVLALGVVAILALIVRQLRAGKQPPAASFPREPRIKLGRAKPSPDMPPSPDAPVTRRRQLVPASVLEAAPASETAAECEMVEEGPAAPAPSDGAGAPSFSEQVFDKLEQAFGLYQRQSITLDEYEEMIAAEQEAVERRLNELTGSSDPDEHALADAESAREAVVWCIDWASRLRDDESDSPSQS